MGKSNLQMTRSYSTAAKKSENNSRHSSLETHKINNSTPTTALLPPGVDTIAVTTPKLSIRRNCNAQSRNASKETQEEAEENTDIGRKSQSSSHFSEKVEDAHDIIA